MTEVTSEIHWLKGLLQEFGIKHDEPMSLLCDSKLAIHISVNPVFHERIKHVHVSTKDQLVDILTKALEQKKV